MARVFRFVGKPEHTNRENLMMPQFKGRFLPYLPMAGRLATDKQSSLFCLFFNYEKRSITLTTPVANVIKLFMAVRYDFS